MASRRGGRRILPSLGAGLSLASALALAVLLPGRPPARAGDGPPPADDPAADGLLAAAAASRAIDREIDRALAEAGLEPTGPSDDAEFLRRLSLDMLGVPPTEGEVLAFLASRDPSKRAAKVEELLAHPLHFDHAADLWGRLLFAGLRRYRSEERGRVQAWLAEGFRAGRGLDDLARDLVTASGNTNDDPALAYVLRFRDGGIPADIAGTTSRIFLGVQIQCAQCHDHPYERWKQGEFAGFAAFFNLVNPRPADPEDRRKGFVVEDPGLRQLERSRGRGGEGADIRGAARAAPRFLGGGEWTDREGTTRREALADWMLSRENPFFAKAMVNRVWSWWFGRGLVNPVDDFRSDNPPSTNEHYQARPSLRYVFYAVHLHLILLFLLLDQSVLKACLITALTVAASLLVDAFKGHPSQRILAASLVVLGSSAIALFLALPSFVLLPSVLFVVKLTFSFSVHHAAIATHNSP